MDVVKYLKEEKNINFTDEQKEVVCHVHGPNLTLAVPGAGKTTCLVARTANLVFTHNIPAKSILTITFSKPSSLDMKNRFMTLFGKFANDINADVMFSTIHSFAYRIVRDIHKNKILIDSNDSPATKNELLKDIYKSITGEFVEEEKLKDISNAISYVKNKMIDTETTSEEWLSDICTFEEFNDVFLMYEEYKKSKNYIDFDDMLTLCYEELVSNANLLNRLRNTFRYIQVDEAQDTSTIQFAIVQLLAKPNNNIFFLGDIDQGIMSFRASDIQYLLDFKKIYPKGSVFTMRRNFRSTKDIVDVANIFIKSNDGRYDYDMYTERSKERPIKIAYVSTEDKELEYIVEGLSRIKNLSESAVLFRHNITCIPLIDRMSRAGIPFYVKDHDNKFFSHWVISDINAFINLALDERDYKSLLKIYYKSNLYINNEAVMESKKHITNKGCLDALTKVPNLRKDQLNRINEFIINIKRLRKSKGKDIIKIIRRDLRYEDYIKKSSEGRGYSLENTLNLISIFELITEDCNKLLDVKKKLDYLENIIKKSSNNKGGNVVTLSTIHGSKGLEWENVYIMSMNEGLFPSVQATKLESRRDNSLMEEERRLCYVAITRAKSYVDLIVPKSRLGKEVYPSKFIWEIEKAMGAHEDNEDNYEEEIRKSKSKSFEKGCSVKHLKHGYGWIVEIDQDNDLMVISYALVGLKKASYSSTIEELERIWDR